MTSPRRRAVIVAGVRTPFVRAFSEYTRLDTIALGAITVRALLDKTGLDPALLESIIWGGVVLPNGAPNVGREIGLDLHLPPEIEACTVTRACASGLQAITNAVAAIERGEYNIAIAGGSESTSNATIAMPPTFIQKVGKVATSGKSGPMDYLRVLGSLSPARDLLPSQPAIRERSTGELMGEACERMAERLEISREAQDIFAVTSHHRAAAGFASGWLSEEVISVSTPEGAKVHADTIVRADTSLEKMAKLKPAFRKGGTLTAANSSALTDGAAAVLIMSEERARQLGLTPLAAFKSWSYVGVDPADLLLMGPAIAMPKALQRAGLELRDMDRVEIHEAFAAQVLSVVKLLESDAFARTRLGRDAAVGTVDPAKLNVYGGSVALGHPFGATGVRMVTTMARELNRLGSGSTAVLGICAAGGLGAAAVMEAV